MCNGTEAKQTKKQTKTYSENSLQLPHPEYRRFSKLEVLRDYSFKKYSYQLNVCHSKCLWQKWCPRCEELYTIMRSYFGIYLIDNESKGLPVRGVITSFFFFSLFEEGNLSCRVRDWQSSGYWTNHCSDWDERQGRVKTGQLESVEVNG